MTQEEIVKKAFDAYPHRPQMVIINNGFGRISIGDLNDDKRKGYVKALTEIESLPKIHGWAARDKNGEIHVFEVEPRRSCMEESWWDRDYVSVEIEKDSFPDITWESEPTEVELLIRRV